MYYNNNKPQFSKDKNLDSFYNPYSFVPISEYVFNYSDKEKDEFITAQDKPFYDGVSGTINVQMKAVTPFCVRSANGNNCMINNSFFVPGTSLKGMIRSVFEIITMSNARNGIANNRFSFRDLNSDEYELKAGKQKSGFFILYQGNYYVIECQNWKITYDEIQEDFNVNIKNARTIADKYRLIGEDYIYKDADGDWNMLFLSGFMNGKLHEYQFMIPEMNESDFIPLKDKEYDDFIFIHRDEIKGGNMNWNFWKRKQRNYNNVADIVSDNYRGIVPCFFRTKTENGQTVVKDLGFSYLYRQPYNKSVHQCLPQNHSNNTYDMTQALFGFVSDKDAQKGRVQVTCARVKGQQANSQTILLGSPKPTYYPFYLGQNKSNVLITFSNKNAVISGRKRFLMRNAAQEMQLATSTQTTSFVPLKAGAEIEFKIHFHNLHEFELGALLSAIKFHNHKECYHSLGYAKPFGYGKMSLINIEIDKTTVRFNNPDKHLLPINDYIKLFEDKLLGALNITKQTWEQELYDLYAISSGVKSGNRQIRYPKMGNKSKGIPNEFQIIKAKKKSLKDFSPTK